MKISGQRGYMINLESVAMTDIVLNMFIFFFISFSLLYTFGASQSRRLDVKLPEASGAAPATKGGRTVVAISSDGGIFLETAPVSLETLRERMTALRQGNAGLGVTLYSDRLARFQSVVSVLDLLSSIGVRNLDIASTRPAEPPRGAEPRDKPPPRPGEGGKARPR